MMPNTLPPLPPIIAEVAPDPFPLLVEQAYEQQLALIQGTADLWSLIEGPPGLGVDVTGLVSGWTPTNEDVGELLTITVRATYGASSDDESWQVQVVTPPPCIAPIPITGFEGYTNGVEVLFKHPWFSSTTKPHLTPTPNEHYVTSSTAYSGTKSFLLQWGFVDDDPSRWLRATTHQASNVPNPTILLDRPIRVRLRLDSDALRVCLGVRETNTNAAVGANGGTTGPIEWIGATGNVGNTPQGGKLLQGQSGVWQTLVFDPLSDPIAGFTGDGILTGTENKGTFEELCFISTGGVGPFTVYIDEVVQFCDRIKGDFDFDGDIDADDMSWLISCASGPAVPVSPFCKAADLDGDDDSDQKDFGLLQACVGMPNEIVEPGCIP